ncbi:sialate O-acetylesterase [Flagellimonas sp. 389]|uniref:sialate O-acetylesterase n=1 Tax=Flagellimonas sp. 389 TaxID=2835862 RepID=UPI001BD43172|nr:sialate O-acetylesterase [Flagellimonas sp. 389]MBS9461863.1 sialate O-acetylesterase [Flagellimonas sp. 389]
MLKTYENKHFIWNQLCPKQAVPWILCMYLLQAVSVYGQVELPSFFADNMVLQQSDSVPIWGTDIPNTDIQITTNWDVNLFTKTDTEGNWKVKLNTPKASFETYQLQISGTTTVTLENILIGEVWFCSGQSNMEMPMKGLGKSPVNGSAEFIKDAENKFIRLFNTERAGSLNPEKNVVGSWKAADSTSVYNFSAIGYLFGKKLFNKLNVPIGIIESAWGGTRIEAWIPKDSLTAYGDVVISTNLAKDPNQRKKPTQIFNGMIHPFQDFTIKGFLWYQGETNRTNPEPYKSYLHTLVNTWRTQWSNTELPFYIVQIAPYAYEQYRKTPAINAALIREAQLQASFEIPNSGLVVTSDVGHCSDIHPPDKEPIAERLSFWALAKQYNYTDIVYSSPVLQEMEVEKNIATLSFGNKERNSMVPVSSFGEQLNGFTIAGKDRIFYPAVGKINENGTISVSNEKVAAPVSVRYGFEDCFEGILFNSAKLPVSPFRTDTW